jgi:hypothetical protein
MYVQIKFQNDDEVEFIASEFGTCRHMRIFNDTYTYIKITRMMMIIKPCHSCIHIYIYIYVYIHIHIHILTFENTYNNSVFNY